MVFFKKLETVFLTNFKGDPTVFGNLINPDNVNEALIKNIKSRKFNGYAHSAGYSG